MGLMSSRDFLMAQLERDLIIDAANHFFDPGGDN